GEVHVAGLYAGGSAHRAAASSLAARNALTWSAVGMGPTAPWPVTDRAAAALAYRAAVTGSSPAATLARKAPSKQSPAPVASTLSTACPGRRVRPVASATSAPSAPSLRTTTRAPRRRNSSTIASGPLRP